MLRLKLETKDMKFEDVKVGDKVYPETICQYTGVTTKDGYKIFEGDNIHIGDGMMKEVVFDEASEEVVSEPTSEPEPVLEPEPQVEPIPEPQVETIDGLSLN